MSAQNISIWFNKAQLLMALLREAEHRLKACATRYMGVGEGESALNYDH
jgi:hypothetical protein